MKTLGKRSAARGAGGLTRLYLAYALVAGVLAALATLGLRAAGKSAVAPMSQPAPVPNGDAPVQPAPGQGDGPAPSSQEADAPGPAPSPRKVDGTSPWVHFWIGVGFAVPVLAIAIWLFFAYPAGPDNARVLWIYTAYMVVPGLSLATLGLYMLRQKRKGMVMIALDRSDYLTMFLQLLPGTAISILGTFLPDEIRPFGWMSLDWVSIILGTGVSIMLVRKFEKA